VKELDSEVAIILVPSLLMSASPLVQPVPDRDEFEEVLIQHETLAQLWESCPRVDWLRWIATEAAGWGVIGRLEIPPFLTANDVRAQFGNPFVDADHAAILERRKSILCCVDEDGQLSVLFKHSH